MHCLKYISLTLLKFKDLIYIYVVIYIIFQLSSLNKNFCKPKKTFEDPLLQSILAVRFINVDFLCPINF